MLTEAASLQESDESVFTTDVTISIESRESEANQLVRRTYDFRWSPEFDEWTFTEYTEERTKDTAMVADRDWQPTRHFFWDDLGERHEVDVPPEVSRKLREVLNVESVQFEHP